jgi:hypothetical protein
MFCKIFEIPQGQILVTLLPGEDHAPVITFTHVTDSGCVCVTKTGVVENDWDVAGVKFEDITEKQAKLVFAAYLNAFQKESCDE